VPALHPLCERGLLAGDVVGRWLPEMSYGYHEAKLTSSTAAFDYARQFEVFRKRAMCNGGGWAFRAPATSTVLSSTRAPGRRLRPSCTSFRPAT
jgi:hypothetical protein